MTVMEFQGHPVDLPDTPPHLRAWFAEEAVIRDIFWRPGPGDVVLDIGCHVGQYTIPALAAGAQVYAVDPATAATAELARLVALNPQLDPTRLTLVNLALAEEGGPPQWVRDGQAGSPWRELCPAADAVFSTVDRFVGLRFTELDHLDWVKIDVEGGELSVLRGGLDTWRRLRPVLLIEDHTDVYPFVAAVDSARQCLDLLDGLGYRVESVRFAGHESPDRTFWICRPGASA